MQRRRINATHEKLTIQIAFSVDIPQHPMKEPEKCMVQLNRDNIDW